MQDNIEKFSIPNKYFFDPLVYLFDFHTGRHVGASALFSTKNPFCTKTPKPFYSDSDGDYEGFLVDFYHNSRSLSKSSLHAFNFRLSSYKSVANYIKFLSARPFSDGNSNHIVNCLQNFELIDFTISENDFFSLFHNWAQKNNLAYINLNSSLHTSDFCTVSFCGYYPVFLNFFFKVNGRNECEDEIFYYFRSIDDLITGRLTKTTAGRYFRWIADRFEFMLPCTLDKKQIEIAKNNFVENQLSIFRAKHGKISANLFFSHDTEKIIEVYEKSKGTVSSCVTDYEANSKWRRISGLHPCVVYGGESDIGIAWLEKECGSIIARALVWEEKKVFTRFYPNRDSNAKIGAMLADKLKALGYKQGNAVFQGAKLNYVSQDHTYSNGSVYEYVALPYIDGDYQSVRIDCNKRELFIDYVNGNCIANLYEQNCVAFKKVPFGDTFRKYLAEKYRGHYCQESDEFIRGFQEDCVECNY